MSFPFRRASRPSSDQVTDETLRGAARRDPAAWAPIIKVVFRRAASMLGTHYPDLKDVAQEALLKVSVALDHDMYKTRRPEGAKFWVQTIATNAVLEHIRKRNVRGYSITEQLEEEPVDESKSDATPDGSYGSLEDALFSLGEPQRIILILHFVDGLTYEEVSQKLGLTSPNTAKSRINRAKNCLLKLVGRPREEDGAQIQDLDNDLLQGMDA